MNYVTDTHSLVWYFTDDKNISNDALSAFENAAKTGSIIVPAIALAEIIYIYQKGRITLTFDETINLMEESACFEIAPLQLEILRITDKIGVDLEMHDRLIVATSIFFDTPLITRDLKIAKSNLVNVIW